MPLDANDRLGPYTVLSKLGEGGMGEVYRAHDGRLNRDVAIKVLPERLAADPHALARFQREAKTIAALSHPNLLAIFDVGDQAGVHYVVTELLEGHTLRESVRQGPLEWHRVAEIGIALADGLAAAHAKGVVHRDLKPENIFVLPDGRVKILDFGLARTLPKAMALDETQTIGTTQQGTIQGTIGYMAPEQVRGEQGEPACDLFALGCVLHELVSGARAFSGNSAVDVLSSILRDPPPPLRNVPAGFAAVIQRCLEKLPVARFDGAREVSEALAAVPREQQAAPAGNSIAVLPFVNASDDPDAEYLSDGIADSITGALARIHGLHVTARNTAFRFKARQDDPQAVGRELGVRVVLTGRVAQHGGSLIVRAELTDVAQGDQLWGERYHRKSADIFEIEEDVARKITDSLRVQLTGEDERKLAKRYTIDSEAYQLYLRGRFHWVQRAPHAMSKAAEYFEQAIALDPSFALAFAGLADCYSVLTTFLWFTPKQGWAKAKAAAAAALALDADLAEAHSSWGYIQMFGEWNLAAAEAAFRKAIALDPTSTMVRGWYSFFLGATKRFEEAEREAQRLLQLDPLSPLGAYLSAGVAVLSGRAAEGERRCVKGLELDPQHPMLQLWLGIAQQAQGRFAEAVAVLETAQRLLGDAPLGVGSLANAYAMAGRREEAMALLDRLLSGGRDGYYIALAYHGLGDGEHALEWLERASDLRGEGTIIMMVAVDPRMEQLRAAPRYRAVLDKMGLP